MDPPSIPLRLLTLRRNFSTVSHFRPQRPVLGGLLPCTETQILWNLQMSVRDGRLNDARDLVQEMVAATEQEPGAQGYEWFLSGDGTACHINERYADSAAVMVHLGVFSSRFAERFLACFEPTSLSVYGEPSAEARAALDGFGATYLGWLGGFKR